MARGQPEERFENLLKSLIAALSALLLAGALHAQTPAAAPVATPPLDPENVLMLDLTTGGRVTIQLRPDVAPNHVERMKTLVRRGFYDGLAFHRVIDGFMAQGGDPKGDGTGGSELPDLPAEFNVLPHARGALSAARGSDENTANSQFFIMFAPRLSLDGKYTVYGRVVSGMQYVDAITRGEPPTDPTRIIKASIGADNVPPPPPGTQPPVRAPVASPADAAPMPGTSAPDAAEASQEPIAETPQDEVSQPVPAEPEAADPQR
jgi:cyclophilin family peptidyl-prolyl cis-trans isomerase